MISLRAKNLTTVSKDLVDGYVPVNPLFLKPHDVETLKGLTHEVMERNK